MRPDNPLLPPDRIDKGFPPENPPQTVHKGLGMPGGLSGFSLPNPFKAAWRRLRRLFYAARMADDLKSRQEGWDTLGAGEIARLEAAAKLEKVFAAARLLPGSSIRVYCWSCRRWLVHCFGECPRLASQPTRGCSCGVHTCFNAAEMGIANEPDDSPDYVDFIGGR